MIELDTTTNTLTNTASGEKADPLTETDMKVLQSLMKSHPNVETREQILHDVWKGKVVTENSLNVSINNIRKSFISIGVPKAIETTRGEGYKLTVVVKNNEKLHLEQVLEVVEKYSVLVTMNFIILIVLIVIIFLFI